MKSIGNRAALPQKMLTLREAADVLNVDPGAVKRWRKSGILRSYSIGPRPNIRFTPEDLRAFLDSSAA